MICKSPFLPARRLNKLVNSEFYQSGKAGERACVAQSEVVSKEDINRGSTGVEMTLTSGWIIKGAAWRRVQEEGGGGGGSDEVRASALKLCQEVCVWANELGEEALSQEAWPRERPVVLASPPRTHTLQRFTHHRSAGVITRRSQASAPCTHVRKTRAHTHTRSHLLCMHSSVNTEVSRQIPVAQQSTEGLCKQRYFCS